MYRKISVDYNDEKFEMSFLKRLSTESCASPKVCDESTLDSYYNSAKILAYIQQTLNKVSNSLKRSACQIDTKFESSGKLSFVDLVHHLTSLRTEYIQRIARPIVHKLFLHPKNANIFNKPVDPVALGIPSYLQRVKTPIDLGTIRNRLHSGQYHTVENCFDDVRLVFTNAVSFNGEGHFISKVAKELLEEFETEVRQLQEKCFRDCSKRVNHECSYCSGSLCLLCGEKCLKFETPILFCHGTNCGQKIRKNAVYYITPDGSAIWCQKCQSALPHILVDYCQDLNETKPLLKKQLLRRKFDEEIPEPWIECSCCGLLFHQICSLYNSQLSDDCDGKRFTCPFCLLEKTENLNTTPDIPEIVWEPEIMNGTTEESVKMDQELPVSYLSGGVQRSWRASSLPRTCLSDFLEELVRDLLVKRGFKDVTDSIVIRVTSNLDRTMELPKAVVDNVKGENGVRLPFSMNYKQKCIQLFQIIDGIDVALFCLYVHEFDSSAPHPNQSTVYIAYLDSVDYFRPMQARSLVYQEILTGYLLWAQARGFKRCHIWACPPQRGDSFIFWCHPSHQKTPSRDRLNAWYGAILTRSKLLGIHNGPGHLWETYFRKFNQREEAPTREAAKRSFVGSGKVVSKKYRKNDVGDRTPIEVIVGDPLLGDTVEKPDERLDNNPFSCPPVFEGDYWIMEFQKLHRIQFQKCRLFGEQNSASNFRKCRDIIKSLLGRPHAVAFRQPVDPVALNIPTYPTIIKHPMDLGTIREKLRSSLYKTVADFIQDVRLTFQNAMLFNPEGHVVHIQADLLLKEFEKSLEQSFQEDYSNTPMDKSMDEFYSLCKLTNLVKETSQVSIPDCAISITTPAVTSTLSDQCLRSPKSVIEDTDDFINITLEKTEFSRIISDDMEANVAATPEVLSMSGRMSSYSASDDTLSVQTLSDAVSTVTSPLSNDEYTLELNNKSLVCLLSDLSKAVHRLNDDLFVVNFNPLDIPTLRSRVRDSQISPLVQLNDKILDYLAKLTPDTSDPDTAISCPIIDSRYTFLEICQFRHYQFDSLRRAKHSSLMMLFQLHHPEDQSYKAKCSHCDNVIEELRWHCEQCFGYEVCRVCKEKLTKQCLEAKSGNSSRKTKIVEWKTDDLIESPDASFHAHPLTPYRISIPR